VPFAVGDALSLSFTLTDEGVAPYEVSPTTPGDQIRYPLAVSGLTGTVGGLAISSRSWLTPAQQERDFAQIDDNLETTSGHVDRISVFHNVTGATAGGFELSEFRFQLTRAVYDGSENFLSDTVLSADKFTQSSLSLPSLTSNMTLIFGNPRVASDRVSFGTNVLTLRAEPVAAVPLPASGVLLFLGIAGFATAGRIYAKPKGSLL